MAHADIVRPSNVQGNFQDNNQANGSDLTLLPEDRLLLRAALLEGDASLAAWMQWREIVPIDEIAESSGWLLPLLYRNLSRQGIPGGELTRYEFVYRHNWYKNQLFYRNVAELFQPVVERGQALVWLKGAALSMLAYGDFGARPINHFDLWVKSEEREGVKDLLVTAGWAQGSETTAIVVEGRARFSDEHGRTIYLYSQLLDPALDEVMRQRVIPLRIRQMLTLALDPVDHLTFLFATLPHWDARSSLLWVADAATLTANLRKEDHLRLGKQLTKLADGTGVQARAHLAHALVRDLLAVETMQSGQSLSDKIAP